MTNLRARDLKAAPADKVYVSITQISDEDGHGLALSNSGKAVLLPNPKHAGDFWAPVSLCRKVFLGDLYGYEIALPAWFLMRESIQY